MGGICRAASFVLLLLGCCASAAVAEGPAPLGWEQLPVSGAARLFAPASGALFARTQTELLRSNDGGMSWENVSLPPPLSIGQPTLNAVVVDPTDHTVLFAAGDSGVYRSLSEPVTWSLSLRSNLPVLHISISPADPSIVYAALAQGSGSFQIHRSDDRGETWSPIVGPLNGAVCGWVVPILEPHPINVDTVFGSWRCHAGREVPGGGLFQMSEDRGETWAEVFRRPAFFPEEIVGGAGANANRFYLRSNRGAEPGGGYVARSDDGGVNWVDVFSSPTRPATGALAVDPWLSGRVYLGLGRGDAGEGGLLVSNDAGDTWSQLGSPAIGSVRSTVLGVDGAYLFAATDTGLWRYPLLGV